MPTQNNVELKITVQDQASSALAKLIRQLQALNKATTDVTRMSKALTASATKANAAFLRQSARLKTAAASAGRYTREIGKVDDALERVERSTQRVDAGLVGVTAGLSAVALGGARAIQTFVSSASDLENITQAFTSILGSAQKAEAAIEQVSRAARDPGLTFDVAARATQRFLAFGVSVEDAIRITRGFANAAVVSGTSVSELDEGLRQLAKSIGTGKIEQDDLNSITERFGPIAQRIRAEFGKTGAEVTKAIGDANKTITQFAVELSNLDKQPRAAADTLSNAMANLRDEFDNAAAALGNELLPIVKAAVNTLTDLLRQFNALPGPVKTATAAAIALSTAIAGITAAAGAAAVALGGLTAALGGAGAAGGAAGAGVTGAFVAATGAVKAFLAALAPIAVATAAIAGLVQVLSELPRGLQVYREVERFDKAFRDATEGLVAYAREQEKGAVATEKTGEAVDRNAKAFAEFRNIITQATTKLGVFKETTDAVGDAAGKAAGDVSNLGKTAVSAAEEATNAFIRTQKEIDGMQFRLNRFNRDRSFLQVEPPAQRRPVGPGASRQAGNLFQPAPVGPSQQDIQRGLQLQERALRDLEFLNERTAMGVANTWDGTFGEIGAGAQATGAALTAVTQAVQTQLQASRNLIAITNKDATDAATRQFRAIGDLSQLTFDYHEQANEGLDLLISKQNAYLAVVNQTSAGFANLSQGFAQLANTGNTTLDGLLNGLSAVTDTAGQFSNLISTVSGGGSFGGSGGGGFGFGRNSGRPRGSPRGGFIQAIQDAGSFLGTVASIINFGEGLVSSITGLFSGGVRGIPSALGRLPAFSRIPSSVRSAQSQQFYPIERAVRRGFETAQPIRVEVTTQLQVNDKTVQEIVQVINRLEGSGRAQLRNR